MLLLDYLKSRLHEFDPEIKNLKLTDFVKFGTRTAPWVEARIEQPPAGSAVWLDFGIGMLIFFVIEHKGQLCVREYSEDEKYVFPKIAYPFSEMLESFPYLRWSYVVALGNGLTNGSDKRHE